MKRAQYTFYLIVSLGVFIYHQISAMTPAMVNLYYQEINTITHDCLIQTCTYEWELPYCDVDEHHTTSAVPLQDEHYCMRLCVFYLASISTNKDLKAIFGGYTLDKRLHEKHSCYDFKRVSPNAPTEPPETDNPTEPPADPDNTDADPTTENIEEGF